MAQEGSVQEALEQEEANVAEDKRRLGEDYKKLEEVASYRLYIHINAPWRSMNHNIYYTYKYSTLSYSYRYNIYHIICTIPYTICILHIGLWHAIASDP